MIRKLAIILAAMTGMAGAAAAGDFSVSIRFGDGYRGYYRSYGDCGRRYYRTPVVVYRTPRYYRHPSPSYRCYPRYYTYRSYRPVYTYDRYYRSRCR